MALQLAVTLQGKNYNVNNNNRNSNNNGSVVTSLQCSSTFTNI